MAMPYMRRMAAPLVAGLLLSGCAGVAPEVTMDAAPITADSNTDATVSAMDAPSAEEGNPTVAIEQIDVDGRTATLPAQIDAAKQTLGADDGTVTHRYIELTGADGTLWQGEWLATEQQSVVFLQVRGSDGQTALRITGDATLAPDTLIGELPEGPADVGPAPDVQVEAVNPQRTGETDAGEQWRFDVAISHPDTGWDDYVDAWLVIGPDGTVYGTRILLHPHETEQPFSRSLSNVVIPADVTEITLRPHDLVSGYDDGFTFPLMMGPQPTATPTN